MAAKWALWIGMLGSSAIAQEAPKEPSAELPETCDVYACLLDPDRDPCDPEEIQVRLVFMRPAGDGEVAYALDPGRSSGPARDNLSWNLRDLEGTHFKVGIASRMTYPEGAESAKPGSRREFLRAFKSPLLPEAETKAGEMDRGGKGVYFKVRLEANDIRALAAGSWTKVYMALVVRGERKAIRSFSCSEAKDEDKP